jgi:hypothetical protein
VPSIDVLEIDSLQISGLSRPAGDQKLKLKSGDLDATGWSFDRESDDLILTIERSPSERWVAVIPAGAAGWRVAPDGRRYKWKAPAGAPPTALRGVSLNLRDGYVKLRASSQAIDASWAAGAATLDVSLEAGSGRWAGATPTCSSSGNTLRCR